MAQRRFERFERFTLVTLVYTVAVVLWGALVRATGSGAGCGSHWPLCNGQVVPREATIQTTIEYAHRATSGISLLLVVTLAVWAYRALPRGHLSRRGALLSVIFMLLEAALGAGLVLLELVAHDRSVMRVVSVSLHLINTSLLTGALTATWLWARGGRIAWPRARVRRDVAIMIGGFLLLAAAGALTALGDTLFPAETLSQGLQQDLAPGAHFLVQLRVIHPLLAVFYTALGSVWLAKTSRELAATRPGIRAWSKFASAALGINIILGLINLLLLAPVPLQILHLLVANLAWIGVAGFSIRAATFSTS